MKGLGHVPRPRNFAIGKLVTIGRFPCKLPLAVLTSTPWVKVKKGLGVAQSRKESTEGIFFSNKRRSEAIPSRYKLLAIC
jgi:hypothetical protein